MTFSHDKEKATAHHYSVEFDNGMVTEMAPTDHAAIVRFNFPEGDASVIFDNVNDDSGLTLNDDGTVSGYSDVRSGLSAGATRLFVHAPSSTRRWSNRTPRMATQAGCGSRPRPTAAPRCASPPR